LTQALGVADKMRCVLPLTLLVSAALPAGRTASAQYFGTPPVYGGFSPGVGYAQRPGWGLPSPYARPTVSPYINLLGRGSAAVNYYGVVRPEFEIRAVQQRQGTRLHHLEGRESTPGPDDLALPQTGHKCYFLNYSHYYGGAP
jgi:hypothetical protein